MSDPAIHSTASTRQWEAHVRRLVRQGTRREEILYTMTDANWPYQDATELVRRVAKKERGKAIWMLVGGLALAAFSVAVTVISIVAAKQDGVVLYGPAIIGVGLFIYGVVRIFKIKA